MFNSLDIQEIHLEITSKCNASCPMCPRNINGGPINPHLPITELNLNDMKSILSESNVKSLKKLFMCGNYGDPAMAKESLKTFQWLRELNPHLFLEIYSNGGVRSTEYWKNLAKVLNRGRFAIDGLENTNHIYRRGIRWNILERNVRSFIDSGGYARWDFIVFRHNEHQVEEARELSKKWGFKEFIVKKTGRFYNHKEAKNNPSYTVINKQGLEDYKIHLPTQDKYINSVILNKSLSKQKMDKDEYEKKLAESNNELESSSIECKSLKAKSLFITAEGFVLPCCYLANDTYPSYKKRFQTELWDIINDKTEGIHLLNGKKYGLDGVLKSSFFQKVLPDSWNQPNYQCGKLQRCTKTCGKKEFDIVYHQVR